MPLFDLLVNSQKKKEEEETPTSRRGGLFELMTGSRGQQVEPEPETPGILSQATRPIVTTVGKILDILGRPVSSLAGASLAAREGRPRVEAALENLTGKRHDSFMDVAQKDFPEHPTMAKVIGFAGDVAADPLNIVGSSVVRKGIATGVKPLAVAAKAVDAKLGAPVAKVAEDIGTRFVPRYGLEVSEKEATTLGKAGKPVADRQAIRSEAKMFEKERESVPQRMKKETLEDFQNPMFKSKATRKQFQEDLNAGAGSTPALDTEVIAQQKRQTALFNREAAAKLQDPANFDPDYGSFWDFSGVKGKMKDYLTNAHGALSAKLGPARHRKFEVWSEAKGAGAETDSAIAWLHRKIKGEKAIVTSQWVQNVASKYGLTSKELATLNPTDILSFRKLEKFPSESPLKKLLQEYVFPEKIANYIDQTYSAAKPQTKIGEIYDHFMKWWRAQATILRPGFHSTNMQGNIFNSWMGGLINPGRYLESVAWNTKFRPAKVGKYTSDEIQAYMEKRGLSGVEHNFFADIEGHDVTKQLVTRLEQGAPTLANKAKGLARHPIDSARLVGSTIEDASKRALFLDGLHKGQSLDDAANTVDKFLFDYADLTQFEKNVMRKIFPFYTWMRKNVPLQVEQLAKQPYKYSGVEKVRRTIERETSEVGVQTPEGDRPQYLREAEAIQIPTEKGKPTQFWTPYLPYQDLNKIPIPGGSGVLEAARDIAGGLGPGVKAPLEMLTNQSLYYGTPLWNQLGPVEDTKKLPASLNSLPQALKEKLFPEVKKFGGGTQYEIPAVAKYLIENLSPITESYGKAAQAVSNPEEVSNPKAAMGQLTGVRVTERNTKQQAEDRKRARSEKKSIKKARQRQRPINKARVDFIYDNQ